jgi:hypothetical protein
MKTYIKIQKQDYNTFYNRPKVVENIMRVIQAHFNFALPFDRLEIEIKKGDKIELSLRSTAWETPIGFENLIGKDSFFDQVGVSDSEFKKAFLDNFASY